MLAGLSLSVRAVLVGYFLGLLRAVVTMIEPEASAIVPRIWVFLLFLNDDYEDGLGLLEAVSLNKRAICEAIELGFSHLFSP